MTPTVLSIQQAVADKYGIALIEMRSHRRGQRVARPRQIAMYLVRHLTVLSLPAIGRHFGGRDHTTVLHAIRKVDELARASADFGERVSALRQYLSVGEEHACIKRVLPDAPRVAG